MSQDTEHILLQSRLQRRYKATTLDEAQVRHPCSWPLFSVVKLCCVQALRLIKVREENSQRQAQLEERIIAPENDEFAVSKGKGSKVASVKRARAASNRRFTSNLTPGDLDGRYRLDEEEGQEDLSAVCVRRASCLCISRAAPKVTVPHSVKSFRKNKNWRPPPQPRASAAVEFSSGCVCLCGRPPLPSH